MGYHSQTQLYPPGIVIRDFAYDSDHELAIGVVSSVFGDEEDDDDGDYDHIDYGEEDDEAYYELEEHWNKEMAQENVEGHSQSDADDENFDNAHEDDEEDELYGTDEINRRAVALFDFIPENDNEVALTEGQIIWISYRHGQGWLVAEDPSTGRNGLVPEEYVEVYHDYDEEIVFEQLPPPSGQNRIEQTDADVDVEILDQEAEHTPKQSFNHDVHNNETPELRPQKQQDSKVAAIVEGVASVAL